MTDDETILICAVRYAMGRRSYIVSDAQGWVRRRWPDLSASARSCIMRDLDVELDREARIPGSLGDRMDVQGWAALRAWCLSNM